MKLIGPPPCFGICLDGEKTAQQQVAGALARQGGETLVPPTARDAWLDVGSEATQLVTKIVTKTKMVI